LKNIYSYTHNDKYIKALMHMFYYISHIANTKKSELTSKLYLVSNRIIELVLKLDLILSVEITKIPHFE